MRVPNSCLTNFEAALRNMVRQFDREYGGVTGKIRVNILGERRLRPRSE